MTPQDAYAVISELLFNLWYTNNDKENYDACILEAIDKLDIVVKKFIDIEDVLSSNKY